MASTSSSSLPKSAAFLVIGVVDSGGAECGFKPLDISDISSNFLDV
jgi:hypothetical protein